MQLLYPILAIVGGLVAASSFVVARRPDARPIFDRLAPFQGAIGVAMLVAGILWLLRALPHLGGLMSAAPVTGVVTIASIVTMLGVGLLLGYALVDRYVLSKNAAASAGAEAALRRLVSVQAPLGLATAALGAALIVL